jgi:glycosyltransferase involved in cell wall biosynthesis
VITAIIPCLNEEKSIATTIEEIRTASKLVNEIIVVDNGSSDDTINIAKSAKVKVFSEPIRGKGFAFRKGLSLVNAESKLIFLVDGDATYSVDKIDDAARLILNSGFDMVVGQRVDEKTESNPYRFGHRFGNRLLSSFQKIMFRSQIQDSLSGWRMFSRGFALSFQGGASQFELEAELNVHAFHLKTSVANIKVIYRDRKFGSVSKLRTYVDGWRILRRNLGLWRSERPLLAYSAMSIPWLITGVVLLARSLGSYVDTGLVPRFPSLIVSVGSFLIASNLWLAGVILERTNLQRTAFARYVYLQEMLSKSN